MCVLASGNARYACWSQIFDIICRGARLYPNNRAVGYRKLINLHVETHKVQKHVDGKLQTINKEWQFLELTPYSFITYKDYKKLIIEL
ncbi:Long-chain-fatty-acid--CoA ligase 1, partial [Emericellopsis cladophorae]